MEDLRVTPEELRNTAKDMRTKVNNMKEELEKASNEMNATSESFGGGTASNLRNKYDELSKRFNSFYSEMISYAEFLEKTAASYEGADQAMKQAAEELL